MSAAVERLQRRVLPRAVVVLSGVDRPRRWAAAVLRRLGGRGVVRLYVAFDDPYSAVALLGLRDRLASRRVRLLVEPVVARGIPGDPAVEAKRRYAVLDAARLARRAGRELARTEPIPAARCAALAAQAAAVPNGAPRVEFCAAAFEWLWFGADGPAPAAPSPDLRALRGSERSMRRRRLYDTPVAVAGGRWFFAHERLAQIEHRLDELGWA